MGFLSDAFTPASILSGGITHINDNVMGPLGIKKGSTLYTLNDAAKHGPIETSIEKGRPANYSELSRERNARLAEDKSGTARTTADIAALVGMMFGGAALGGAGAAGGTAGGTGAGTGTAAGSYGAGSYGTAAGYGGANAAYAMPSAGATGATGAAGFGSYVKPTLQSMQAAQIAKGLLTPPPQAPMQAPQNNSVQGAQLLQQIYQNSMNPQVTPEQQARTQRRSMWG